MIIEQIQLIKGGSHVDERGILQFFNKFKFDQIKRFYTIEHPDESVVRAWQGHKNETKNFFVTQGSFTIAAVKIDDWHNPSKDLKPEHFKITADEPTILIVPGGYANGIKANEPNAKLVVFSSSTLVEAKEDDYRFSSDLWLDWSKI